MTVRITVPGPAVKVSLAPEIIAVDAAESTAAAARAGTDDATANASRMTPRRTKEAIAAQAETNVHLAAYSVADSVEPLGTSGEIAVYAGRDKTDVYGAGNIDWVSGVERVIMSRKGGTADPANPQNSTDDADLDGFFRRMLKEGRAEVFVQRYDSAFALVEDESAIVVFEPIRYADDELDCYVYGVEGDLTGPNSASVSWRLGFRLPNRRQPKLPASLVEIDASGFNGNLASTDDTVQKVAQKVDDLTVGASESSLAAAKAGTDSSTANKSRMTPRRVKQAIAAQVDLEQVRIDEWIASPGTITFDDYDIVDSISGNDPQGDIELTEGTGDPAPLYIAVTAAGKTSTDHRAALVEIEPGDEILVHNTAASQYVFGTVTGVTYQTADGNETNDPAAAAVVEYAYTIDAERGLDQYDQLTAGAGKFHYRRAPMARDLANADDPAVPTVGGDAAPQHFMVRAGSALKRWSWANFFSRIKKALIGDIGFVSDVQSPSDPYTFAGDYTFRGTDPDNAPVNGDSQWNLNGVPVLNGVAKGIVIQFAPTDAQPAVDRFLQSNEYVFGSARFRITGSVNKISTRKYQATIQLIAGAVPAANDTATPVLEPDSPHRKEYIAAVFKAAAANLAGKGGAAGRLWAYATSATDAGWRRLLDVLKEDANTNAKRADYRAALSPGRLAKSIAGNSDVTLTDAEAAYDSIELTGAKTGDVVVTLPREPSGVRLIRNLSTGAFAAKVKATDQADEAALTLAAGDNVVLHHGGSLALFEQADVIAEAAELSNGSVNGAWTDISADTYQADDVVSIHCVEEAGERRMFGFEPIRFGDVPTAYLADRRIEGVPDKVGESTLATMNNANLVSSGITLPDVTADAWYLFRIHIGSNTGAKIAFIVNGENIGRLTATTAGNARTGKDLTQWGVAIFGSNYVYYAGRTSGNVILFGKNGETFQKLEIYQIFEYAEFRIKRNGSKLQYRLSGDISATNKIRVNRIGKEI